MIYIYINIYSSIDEEYIISEYVSLQYIEKYTNDAMMHNTAPKPPLPVTDTYMMFGLPCQQDDLIIRPLELQV